MYERIVVGTDGSERALDAVRTAGRLAELCGISSLHVVTAFRAYSPYEISRIQADLPEEYRDFISPDLEGAEHFEQAKSVLGQTVKMVTHKTSGDPADSILTVAEQVGADLIVVGARGLGAVERFVRGSVSTKVSHHAPCDVLIVEHDD